MKLTTDEQVMDYYFGYVTRLADEIGIYDIVYEWACKFHCLDDWKDKAEELEILHPEIEQ